MRFRISDQALAKFRELHGVEPKEVIRMEIEDWPTELVAIGELTQINYEPYEHSQRAGHEYTHEVGDTGSRNVHTTIVVACGPDGKGLYLVPVKGKWGQHPDTGSRGIVG